MRFAPTGRQFAAATTEGLLLYTLDDTTLFDPFELDESVTPAATMAAAKAGNAEKAMIVSVCACAAAGGRACTARPHTHALP